MRIARVILFTLLNGIIFILLQGRYEIVYADYFGGIIFIPDRSYFWLYIALFLFQALYQAILVFELIFKKFVTKRLNYGFAIPIIFISITINRSPFQGSESILPPQEHIRRVMAKVQLSLEHYRVEHFFYPKAESRFQILVKDISKKSGYTKQNQSVPVTIYYRFDATESYLENTEKLPHPFIMVHISGSAKKYWITAFYQRGFIKGKIRTVHFKGEPLIIEPNIQLREKIREMLKTEGKKQ